MSLECRAENKSASAAGSRSHALTTELLEESNHLATVISFIRSGRFAYIVYVIIGLVSFVSVFWVVVFFSFISCNLCVW